MLRTHLDVKVFTPTGKNNARTAGYTFSGFVTFGTHLPGENLRPIVFFVIFDSVTFKTKARGTYARRFRQLFYSKHERPRGAGKEPAPIFFFFIIIFNIKTRVTRVQSFKIFGTYLTKARRRITFAENFFSLILFEFTNSIESRQKLNNGSVPSMNINVSVERKMYFLSGTRDNNKLNNMSHFA